MELVIAGAGPSGLAVADRVSQAGHFPDTAGMNSKRWREEDVGEVSASLLATPSQRVEGQVRSADQSSTTGPPSPGERNHLRGTGTVE